MCSVSYLNTNIYMTNKPNVSQAFSAQILFLWATLVKLLVGLWRLCCESSELFLHSCGQVDAAAAGALPFLVSQEIGSWWAWIYCEIDFELKFNSLSLSLLSLSFSLFSEATTKLGPYENHQPVLSWTGTSRTVRSSRGRLQRQLFFRRMLYQDRGRV